MRYHFPILLKISVKNYFLSTAVIVSLCLCFSSAGLVDAGIAMNDGRPVITRAQPVSEYFTTVAIFVGADVDPATGFGTLTTKRTDKNRGAITTVYATSNKTVYQKRYGGAALLSDFKAGEEISIYAIRNKDASLTALTVTNNNLWFLDPVIAEAVITNADLTNNSLTLKRSDSTLMTTVSYNDETSIIKPQDEPGTEADLIVGTKVKIRGTARKTGGATSVEKSFVIWLLR